MMKELKAQRTRDTSLKGANIGELRQKEQDKQEQLWKDYLLRQRDYKQEMKKRESK